MEPSTQEMLPLAIFASEWWGSYRTSQMREGWCRDTCRNLQRWEELQGTQHRTKARRRPHTCAHTMSKWLRGKRFYFAQLWRSHPWTSSTKSGHDLPNAFPLCVSAAAFSGRDVLAPAATAPQKEAPSWQSQNEPSTSSPTWVGSRPTWHTGMMTFTSQMPHE